MRLMLRKPDPAIIQQFLDAEAKRSFSYSAVGATASQPPSGYDVDHTRIKLGEGEPVFLAAKAALERWEHFRLGWAEAWPSDTPIQEGGGVAMVARSFGLWSLNACRIVYVVNEDGKRFGFAYGTLPGHVESGEERFLIERDMTDGSVWYDILAFSRPRHILAHLGYPWVRRLQTRFREDSGAAMQRAVSMAFGVCGR